MIDTISRRLSQYTAAFTFLRSLLEAFTGILLILISTAMALGIVLDLNVLALGNLYSYLAHGTRIQKIHAIQIICALLVATQLLASLKLWIRARIIKTIQLQTVPRLRSSEEYDTVFVSLRPASNHLLITVENIAQQVPALIVAVVAIGLIAPEILLPLLGAGSALFLVWATVSRPLIRLTDANQKALLAYQQARGAKQPNLSNTLLHTINTAYFHARGYAVASLIQAPLVAIVTLFLLILTVSSPLSPAKILSTLILVGVGQSAVRTIAQAIPELRNFSSMYTRANQVLNSRVHSLWSHPSN
ncbi:hypothetical protein TPY_2097 [Sulfobacillus acidophilus TPY]|nr:hypothetical protein TPY_2097 [Sulfobacillus acidophilus TPY]